MANPIIKATQIVRAGYEYQDLVGIQTLIRYYNEPTSYHWIKLEAAEAEYGALDDLIAARSDGSFEYTQVKFTVDKGGNELDWDWLLAKKRRGTSLLHKWSSSLAGVKKLGVLHSAQLRTNRPASAKFRASMSGKRVDLEKVDAPTRMLVEAECGGAGAAKEFFAEFDFNSGELDLDRFERKVKSELVPSYLDPSGWAYFRDQVRRWSIRRNEPYPDGKVTFAHLEQIITRKRAIPIRQDFRVPVDYQVPSATFDAAFHERINEAGGNPTILWGTPGRGKSTYLSYLTKDLRSSGKPVIRHHYFVSAEDPSDRVSFWEIANSLTSQLLDRYPEATSGAANDPHKLRRIIEDAGAHYQAKGETLFVIIDGLDHVWRETRQVDQLNFLFNQLLPAPPGISVLVGTQRVDASQLPSRLMAAVKANDWVELPSMNEVAVSHWVESQKQSGRLLLKEPADAEQLRKVSAAFFEVSRGHPLHLIYAFESLTRSGGVLSEDDVRSVPPCPDGDIRVYYESLWNSLTPGARDILHALAGSEFPWPTLGVRQCLGNYDEVSFLLDHRASSTLVPFHGSIFAYVKERSDHNESFTALLPKIVSWLETDAQPYWRWGWLWLCKARLGDFAPMLAGVGRKWAIESLAEGWPERHAIKILKVAEEHVFRKGDLPLTIKLRSLKMRMMNAREFQIQRYEEFEEAAIASAKNEQQLLNLVDEIEMLSDSELGAIARAASPNVRTDVISACVEECRRRITVWIELRHRPAGEFISLVHLLIDVASRAPKPEVKRMFRFLSAFSKPTPHVEYLIERLRDEGQLDALRELRNLLRGKRWERQRRAVTDGLLIAKCLLGSSIEVLPRRTKLQQSPLYSSWQQLHHRDKPLRMLLPPPPSPFQKESYEYGIDFPLQSFFYNAFFSALAVAKSAQGDWSFIYPGVPKGTGWVYTAINVLEDVARSIAHEETPPSLSAVFIDPAIIDCVASARQENGAEGAQYLSFAAALRSIAFDLHVIGTAPYTKTEISMEELELARSSVHWNDELFIERCLMLNRRVLSRDVAREIITEQVEHLNTTINEFNERAEQWVQISRFAERHEVDPHSMIRHAADCLLSYGWRKDVYVFDVLYSVGCTHDPQSSPAEPWIRTLTPIIDKICEFTDGAETRHAAPELLDVVARSYPSMLPDFYEHYVSKDSWKYADDCLKSLIEVADYSLPATAALASTLLDRKTLAALEEVGASQPIAKQLYISQVEFLGGLPVDHAHRGTENETTAQTEKKKKDPTKRKPNQLKKLIDDTSDLDFPLEDKKNYFQAWLEYWTKDGRGLEALEAVRTYFEQGDPAYGASEILDLAFEVSLDLEGSEKAYWFIVNAQIHRRGWQSYWTSEKEVLHRLGRVATLYPGDWLKFVWDSSEPEGYFKKRGYSFSIGLKYLVSFLLLVGQRTVAVTVVDALVQVLAEEVGDQPIPEATWLV